MARMTAALAGWFLLVGLVGAGMLSVLLYPLIGTMLRGARVVERDVIDEDVG